MKQQAREARRVAAIYCRVSTDAQEDNTSLGEQERLCREYAAMHGYTVGCVYLDTHSGYDLWERPQLRMLRESARRGTMQAVIVLALDRLSRKQVHTAILADEFERAGVALVFVTETFDQTATGEFLRSAKAFAAELEREKIRERTQRGMQARIRSGKLRPGGSALYGYRWRDEQKSALDIDPVHGPIVRRIFAEMIGGRSLRAVVVGLNADGIPTPKGSARWGHSTIQQMVSNPNYTGQAVANRYRAVKVPGRRGYQRVARPTEEHVQLPQDAIPPLVTPAEFAAVAAILQRNRLTSGRPNRDPEAFLLGRGFIVCGSCGRLARTAWTRRTQAEHPRPVYRVDHHSEAHPDCPCCSMSAPALDAAVWARVARLLLNPAIIAAEVARHRDTNQGESDLAAVDRQRDALQRKRTNLTRRLALFDDDHEAAPLVAEIKALSRQIQALDAERDLLLTTLREWHATAAGLAALEAWCGHVASRLDTLSYEERRLALRALGISVRLYRADHVPRWEMTASIPLDDPGELEKLYSHS